MYEIQGNKFLTERRKYDIISERSLYLPTSGKTRTVRRYLMALNTMNRVHLSGQ